MLSTLPFYKELSIIKTDQEFKGYAISYKIEIIDKEDQLAQLEASKSSIKDFFNDLLEETESFKCQIIVKILLKKYKGTETEFPPIYFNLKTKPVINHKFDLDKSFQ